MALAFHLQQIELSQDEFAAHQIGSASAAYFAGLMRADLGSYLQAFMLSGLLCFAAALMVLFIGVDWRRQRPAVSTV